MIVRSFVVPAAAGLLFAAASPFAHASIVLTVDITNPAAAVFASTGAPALATRSGVGDSLFVTGLFIGGPTNQSRLLVGDLRSTQGTFLYDRLSGNSGGLLPGFGNQTQAFVAGQQALSGSGVANATLWTLAPVGTVGDLVVRNSNGVNTGIVIGQYQIIPAPGAAALLAMGGVLAARRRRPA